MKRIALIAAVALLSITPSWAQVRARDQRQSSTRSGRRGQPSKPTASDLFGTLDFMARTTPNFSLERWRQVLTEDGFKLFNESPTAGIGLQTTELDKWNGSSWEKRDPTGTLRAMGFFLKDDDFSVWLWFFPAIRVPMPDPVVAQLLRDADSTELQDNGGVEIGFKTKTLSVEGKTGRRREFATLIGSTVTLRRVVIEWP